MNDTLAPGRTWGVAVVGAGPAGAMTARLAALAGADVLLLDRSPFPRPKVCGCCLNGRALEALRRGGLEGLPARLGAVETREVVLASGGRSARLAMPGGVSLSRQALDAALAGEAVRAGARFVHSAEARLEGEDENHLILSVRHGGQTGLIRARAVVAANGLGGRLAARMPRGRGLVSVVDAPAEPGARIGAGAVLEEAPAFYGPGTVYMACGPAGYTGLVRLEDGRLDVASALDAEAVRRAGGPGPLAEANVRGSGWPVPAGLAGAGWRGTPTLTRGAAVVAARRLFVVGDAAGYVEPFTGEGMAWALASALALGPIAAEAARAWRPELAARWKREHRRVVADSQLACRVLAFVLRRPWLTAALVGALSLFPTLARPVLRSLGSPGPEAR